MISVNTHEAKSKLSTLVRLIEEKGERIMICRNGKPIAEICPITSTNDPFKQNPELMGIRFSEDPILPLREDDWPEEYR